MNRLNDVYKTSFTYRTLNKTGAYIKIAFRRSILGRATEIGEGGQREIIETSSAVKFISKNIRKIKELVIRNARKSVSIGILMKTADDFSSMPLKVGGIIAVTGIGVNFILLILLRQEMLRSGIILRVVLLLLGFASLFSSCRLEGLKDSSLLLRWLVKKG